MYMQNLADEVWDFMSANYGVPSDPLASRGRFGVGQIGSARGSAWNSQQE